MKIKDIHQLNMNMEMEKIETIQNELSKKILLKNTFHKNELNFCAGVDLAYWEKEGSQWGACSIIVIHYQTRKIIEKASSSGMVTFPYIPGYLAFRELPLILKAAKTLSTIPDIFMFDGNGYLHPRHMGLATHASFFLNKPTIGIAKNYFKINGVIFSQPENRSGSIGNIIINNDVYGRSLRTHKDVKPIFISCGNYIDLQTATEVTLNLINDESRLPIPIRLADLEANHMKHLLDK